MITFFEAKAIVLYDMKNYNTKDDLKARFSIKVRDLSNATLLLKLIM